MKYTDHFSFYLRNYGIPQLNKVQWERLLNIVFMEALITATSECGSKAIKTTQTYRHTKSLNELTGRKKPEHLLREMLTLSQTK